MTQLQKLKAQLKENVQYLSNNKNTDKQKMEKLDYHYTIIDSIINLVGFEQYLIIVQNIERD